MGQDSLRIDSDQESGDAVHSSSDSDDDRPGSTSDAQPRD